MLEEKTKYKRQLPQLCAVNAKENEEMTGTYSKVM
jgi:hypothetical protein